MIEIKVLGPLEVVRDRELVALPGDRERAVLAVLAIHAGETVSADRLIDRLWGDDLPRNAPNALQAIVSRLRRALGADGIIHTSKPGYLLDKQACEIDSRRFEDLVRRARALRSNDPDCASDLLAGALALWRGAPFADLEYEDEIHAERVRLEELRVGALEDKIDADLALGRHRGETVADLERLVAAEPFRERPRAQLMLALYRCGRQGDAITAYHETPVSSPTSWASIPDQSSGSSMNESSTRIRSSCTRGRPARTCPGRTSRRGSRALSGATPRSRS